jgi:hypothetical protein
MTVTKRILTLAVLACALALPAAPARAAGWLDGNIAYTYAVNCSSMIFGSPYMEAMSGHYAGQYVNDPIQGVGEIFYIRTIVGGLGAPCAGPMLVPEFRLHQEMELAISQNYPVLCYGQLPSYGNTWKRFTGADCPQNPSAGRFSRSFRFIPSQGAYPLPQGSFIQIQVPVYVKRQFKGMGGPNDSENCGGCFFAPSQVMNGSSDPTGFAKQWVNTDKTYPSVAFPSNPKIAESPNQMTLRAFLYNYYAGGNAAIGLCRAADYQGDQTKACAGDGWRATNDVPISTSSYAVQLDGAFGNLQPNTAYKAMVFFDFVQPETGVVQNGTSQVIDVMSGPGGAVAGPVNGGPPPATAPPPANAPKPPTQAPAVDNQSTSIGDIRKDAKPNEPLPKTDPPPPPADTRPLALVGGGAAIKRTTLVRKGLSVPVSCNRACSLTLELLLPGKLARKHRLAKSAKRPVVIARGTIRLAAGAKGRVVVKLTKKARAVLKRKRIRTALTLRTTARGGPGDPPRKLLKAVRLK